MSLIFVEHSKYLCCIPFYKRIGNKKINVIKKKRNALNDHELLFIIKVP